MFLNFTSMFTVELAESSLKYEHVDQNFAIRLFHVLTGKLIEFTVENHVFELTDEKSNDSIF